MRLTSDHKKLIARLLVFVVCVFVGYQIVIRAPDYGMFGGAIVALIAMAFFLAGCVAIAPSVAGFFSEKFGGLFDPSERGKPTPVYSIPESKYKREQYAEALEEFEKLSRQFPNEFRPYQAMLEITLIHLKDRTRADAIYQRGLRSLKQAEQCELLTKIYNAIIAREFTETKSNEGMR